MCQDSKSRSENKCQSELCKFLQNKTHSPDFFVSNLGRSYKNYQISNAYNFLCSNFFENLTGNLIVLVLKNKVTSLFL